LLVSAQGGGRAPENAQKGFVEAAHAAEAAGQRDVGHRQGGLADELLGQHDAACLCDGDGRGAQVLTKEASQVPVTQAEALRQCGDVAIVERAHVDQGKGALH